MSVTSPLSPPSLPREEPLTAATTARRDRLLLAGGLVVLFAAVAVVMTFPNLSRFNTFTPGDYGDPIFSQWLLRWEVHALFSTDPLSVFDPNIYWPVPNTLVYSDPSLAAVPVAAVFGFLFGWPAAYNLLYLLGWVASMAAMYALSHRLTGSRPGSILAAFVFSFAGVRLGHYGHFPMLSAFLVPLSLWLLLRFLEERRWWQAVTLGVCMAAVIMNAGYVAIVLLPGLVVVAVGWLVADRFHPGPRFAAGLALAGIVALVLAYPVIHKYRAHGDWLRRPYGQDAAAVPSDFWAPPGGTRFHTWLDDRTKAEFEHRLFLGILPAGLGVVGAVDLVRRRRHGQAPVSELTADPEVAAGLRGPNAVAGLRGPNAVAGLPGPNALAGLRGPNALAGLRGPNALAGLRGRNGLVDLRRRGVLLVFLAGLPALVLAFGKFQTILGFGVKLPYWLVADWPGFRSIRAFGRLTVIPLAALAVLVAVGYEWLLRKRSALVRGVAAVVLGGLILAEYSAEIMTSRRFDTAEHTAVNHALARLPEGAVLEMPIAIAYDVSWGYTEPPRMLLSTIDWKPRVNGYSGYTPPYYEGNDVLINTMDDGGPVLQEAMDLIDSLGVRYIVIRTAPFAPILDHAGVLYASEKQTQNLLAGLPPDRVEHVSREGSAVLITLRPPPSPPSPPPPVPN